MARRTQFIELLLAEGRHSVLEIGTGPGRDAAAFVEVDSRLQESTSHRRTLLQVSNSVDTAMAEICRVLEPGAPLAVGLWGGVDREGPNPRDTIQPRRFFSNRSDDRIRHMLSPFGVIERFETWSDSNVAGWHYQWVVLRMPELPSGRRLDHELA